MTFGEIFNHVGREVQRKTDDSQTPLQSTFPDHGGGCVALFTPGLEPGRQSIHERLQSLERTVDEELEERKRFSDLALIGRLKEEAEASLWPAVTQEVAAYREWLDVAREVHDRLPMHEEALARVRQQVYLEQVLAGHVEEGAGTEPDWKRADFDDLFRFQTFGKLVTTISEDLVPLIASVEARRVVASEMLQATLVDPGARWDAAIASIRNREQCPQYDGLVLSPQVGLIPIGRDPDSGLWEFGLWKQTGEIPTRAADGSLTLEDHSGLVFVLIPGGTFAMGATSIRSRRAEHQGLRTNFDPQANPKEAPVHEVTLDPFFLSKYEMTQGQWDRFTGTNPSIHGVTAYLANWDRLPPDRRLLRLHPVERIGWYDCERVLRQLGLSLPTEAQWEYAARGGTTTVWWSGSKKESLAGVANLADAYAQASGGPPGWVYAEWLDDGFVVHAPVGRFRANPFGLHEVIGNVSEWCRDVFGFYELPVHSGDGDRSPESADHLYINRGGAFDDPPSLARSAYRGYTAPESSGDSLGVRPSRALLE